MQFSQLDRIIEIEAGKSIKGCRILRGDESYLRDHFPLFPVMPGVIILEALYQAASWLLRYSNDFTDTIVELREARNVKFQDFVQPGMELIVTAEIIKQEGSLFTFKVTGTVHGDIAVSARLLLDCYSMGERDSNRAYVDDDARAKYPKEFKRLFV